MALELDVVVVALACPSISLHIKFIEDKRQERVQAKSVTKIIIIKKVTDTAFRLLTFVTTSNFGTCST